MKCLEFQNILLQCAHLIHAKIAAPTPRPARPLSLQRHHFFLHPSTGFCVSSLEVACHRVLSQPLLPRPINGLEGDGK
jgi:hypothetical protein